MSATEERRQRGHRLSGAIHCEGGREREALYGHVIRDIGREEEKPEGGEDSRHCKVMEK